MTRVFLTELACSSKDIGNRHMCVGRRMESIPGHVPRIRVYLARTYKFRMYTEASACMHQYIFDYDVENVSYILPHVELRL